MHAHKYLPGWDGPIPPLSLHAQYAVSCDDTTCDSVTLIWYRYSLGAKMCRISTEVSNVVPVHHSLTVIILTHGSGEHVMVTFHCM